MMLDLRSALLGVTAMSLGLAACSGGEDAPDDTSNEGSFTAIEATSTNEEAAPAPVLTLADGPDVCFREISKHLGADTKVAEVMSFFSSGSEIDSDDRKPAGEMTLCTVNYQNPDDPRKLLGMRLDLRTGKFSEPNPLEISVMGGNAAEFDLNDHVIPLSDIGAEALTSVMDAQKTKLEGVYSKYAWSGVRLEGPDAFSNTHTLRLDMVGRLASNDIKKNGYASVTTDGKTIKRKPSVALMAVYNARILRPSQSIFAFRRNVKLGAPPPVSGAI